MNPQPRLLVLGAQGQLGHALVKAAEAQGLAVLGLGRAQAPLDQAEVLEAALVQSIRAFLPSHLINAAAYTAVDQAEQDPETARAVNALAPGLIGRVALAHGLPMIHVSTDYVFDGRKPIAEAYAETDPTGPQSVYGKTKLEGERALAASGATQLTFRTSWVFSAHGGNFMKTMIRLAQLRPSLAVVHDQLGAPTSAECLADQMLTVCRSWPEAQDPRQGVYHLTASGVVSWHGYAQALLAQARVLRPDLPWQVVSDEQVVGVSSQAYLEGLTADQRSRMARRPQNSQLSGAKFEQAFGLPRPSWQAQLSAVLQDWAQG